MMTKVKKDFIHKLIYLSDIETVSYLLQKDKEIFIYEISDDKDYIEVDEFVMATLLNVDKNHSNIIL